MRHRLSQLRPTLLLGLCLIFLALWLRTGMVEDSILWGRPGGSFVAIQSNTGRLMITVADGYTRRRPLTWKREPNGTTRSFPNWPPGYREHPLLGLGIFRGTGWFGWPHWTTPGASVTAVSVCWSRLALLAGIVPAARFVKRFNERELQRKRARAHLCPNCGYDLRATPWGCPECGAAAVTPRTAFEGPAEENSLNRQGRLERQNCQEKVTPH